MDNIKTYKAKNDSYGNPHRILVNESRKWIYDGDPYAFSPKGMIIDVGTQKELKSIARKYIARGFKRIDYDELMKKQRKK